MTWTCQERLFLGSDSSWQPQNWIECQMFLCENKRQRMLFCWLDVWHSVRHALFCTPANVVVFDSLKLEATIAIIPNFAKFKDQSRKESSSKFASCNIQTCVLLSRTQPSECLGSLSQLLFLVSILAEVYLKWARKTPMLSVGIFCRASGSFLKCGCLKIWTPQFFSDHQNFW